MDYTTIQLRTKRLLLKPTSLASVAELYKEFTPQIALYMYPEPYDNETELMESSKKYIAKMQNGECLAMDVFVTEKNGLIGRAFLIDILTKKPELGIWLKQSAHGHDYGKEIMHALYAWAKENIQYSFIKYPVDKRNIPSKKIIESMGGTVGKGYDVTNKAGKVLYILEYRLKT